MAYARSSPLEYWDPNGYRDQTAEEAEYSKMVRGLLAKEEAKHGERALPHRLAMAWFHHMKTQEVRAHIEHFELAIKFAGEGEAVKPIALKENFVRLGGEGMEVDLNLGVAFSTDANLERLAMLENSVANRLLLTSAQFQDLLAAAGGVRSPKAMSKGIRGKPGHRRGPKAPLAPTDPTSTAWQPTSAQRKAGLGEPRGAGTWKFDATKDIDFRAEGKSFGAALDRAFEATGVPRGEFRATKFARDAHGKTRAVEWVGPGGAEVNVDFPHARNGPAEPHVGYRLPGKGGIVGHVILTEVPVNRTDK